MIRLVLATLLLIGGFATAVLATAFTLFSPEQFLTLADTDPTAAAGSEVSEVRIQDPDLTRLKQLLRVPGRIEGRFEECDIQFITRPSGYPEELVFSLVRDPKTGKTMRFQVYVSRGEVPTLLFDSTENRLEDNKEVRLWLDTDQYDGRFVLRSSSTVSGAKGAWVNVRIRHRYGLLWVITALLLTGGVACRFCWLRGVGSARERRRGLAKVALLLAALAVALAAGEATFRAIPRLLTGDELLHQTFPNRTPLSVVKSVAQRSSITITDPDLPQTNIRFKPNLDEPISMTLGAISLLGQTAYRPRAIVQGQFVTDARGFPNLETLEKARIVVLGDSFCEGLPTDRQWPTVLGRLLEGDVANFSVRSHGTIEERLLYEKVASQLEPEIVILAFFEGNDLGNNEATDKRLAEGRSRTAPGREMTDLIRQMVLRQRPRWRARRGADRSMLWTVVANRVGRWLPLFPSRKAVEWPVFHAVDAFTLAARQNRLTLNSTGPDRLPRAATPMAFFLPDAFAIALAPEKLEGDTGWQVTRREIVRLHQEVRTHGGRLGVVNLPIKLRVYWPLIQKSLGPERTRPYLQALASGKPNKIHPDQLEANLGSVAQLLRQLCDSHTDADGQPDPIPILDDPRLVERLRESIRAGKQPYFADDTHMNVTGHRITAEVIADFIRTLSTRTGPTPGGETPFEYQAD